MTLDALKSLIREAAWFERLCEPTADDQVVRITTLAPWADEPTGDQTLERIADQMDWLPSSRDQEDPIHGRSLEELAERIGERNDISLQILDVYRATVSALGRFKGHPALRTGLHDFNEAARGAALYASRRATYEILVGKPGFWCRLMQIYNSGHWPCGILPSGQVVVL